MELLAVKIQKSVMQGVNCRQIKMAGVSELLYVLRDDNKKCERGNSERGG